MKNDFVLEQEKNFYSEGHEKKIKIISKKKYIIIRKNKEKHQIDIKLILPLKFYIQCEIINCNFDLIAIPLDDNELEKSKLTR